MRTRSTWRHGTLAEASGTVADGDDLAIGLESVRRLAWGDAYRALRLAERSGSLAGEDLEALAAAAYLLGYVDECRQALQRGHRAYLAAGNPRRAARCLFWVAFTLLLEVSWHPPMAGLPGPAG